MGSVYKFKPGFHVVVEAQTVGEEVTRVRREQNGLLEPKHLVAASKSPDAPLHACFEWNNAKAATAYRVEQAKYLIRSVELVIDKDEPQPRSTRAFVSVKRDERQGYATIAEAMSDADLRRQVVAQALSDLEAWRKRYAELDELAALFAAIDEARTA